MYWYSSVCNFKINWGGLMSLKLLALKAHEKAQTIAEEKVAKKLARQTNETRKQFIRDFKLEPDEVVGNNAVSDGYKLRLVEEGWILWGRCSRCNLGEWSDAFNKLEELGGLMIKFKPNSNHIWVCKS